MRAKQQLVAALLAAAVLAAAPAIVVAQDLQAAIALFNEGKYAEAEAGLRNLAGTDASAYLAAALARQRKYAEAEASAKAALAESATHENRITGLDSVRAQRRAVFRHRSYP